MRPGYSRFKAGFFLLLALFCYSIQAQEICNNGIDDDRDGRVDLQDDDCINGIYNLIRNHSFESVGACPDGWSKLHYAAYWLQPHPTAGSTDLYHKCGDCHYKLFGNIQHSPLPPPHGEAFAGFYDTQQYDTYGEYKEYLATCLFKPLRKNRSYRVRFSLGFLKPLQNTTVLPSKSPVNISLFGNPSCNALQYSTGFRRCPMTMQGEWTELKKMEVSGSPGEWVTVEAEIEAPADINGLVIGPSCTPNAHDGQNYYLIDQILLYEKELHHLPQIDRTGDVCADTLVLSGKIDPVSAISTYQWFKGGIALPGETAPQLRITRTHHGEGNYAIRVTNNGTSYLSPEEQVTINDQKFAMPDSVALCGSNQALLRPELNATGTTCPIRYLWQDGSTEPTFKATAPGWHWLETSKNGCRFRDSVFVYSHAAPAVDLGADTVLCPGEQLTLTAGDSTLAYRWQDGSSQTSYAVTKAGLYAVTVSNRHCVSADTIVVQSENRPEVRFLQDSSICEGEEKVLKPYLYGNEFLWNTGSASAELTINMPGVYEVVAKNQCGVTRKALTVVLGNCQFFLPNAFTPNGDGLNDKFGLKEFGFIRQYAISIYNRWGEVVYHSADPSQQWNGLLKGRAAPQGAYVWMVNYTDWLNRKFNRKGTFVLIR